jgi:septum formation protein
MFFEKLKGYHIILASGSPRRQSLLRELGLEFEILVNDTVDETYPPGLSPYEIPVYLAELKAQSIQASITESTVLITADTIVWLNGQVADKPSDREDAVRILTQLSGSRHEVITGVCFRSGERIHSFYSSTLVWFSNLSEEEIIYYIDRYEPYDKAGAYGIQEWIGFIGIEKIDGSYFNVMGLPVQKMYHELKDFLGE